MASKHGILSSLEQTWPSLIPDRSPSSSAVSNGTLDSTCTANHAPGLHHGGYALHGDTGRGPFYPPDIIQQLRNLELHGPSINVVPSNHTDTAGAGAFRGVSYASAVQAAAPRSMAMQHWMAHHQHQQQQQQQAIPVGYGVGGYSGLYEHHHHGTARVGGSPPGVVAAEDGDPDAVYAYCFARGNGEYTRLIPADMLPALKDVPRRQKDHRGMIVLPVPVGRPAHGSCTNTFPAVLKGTAHAQAHTHAHAQGHGHPHHYREQCPAGDPIQSRIDTIVKTTPPSRKNKVFCDKWVHEGTCAFTQQGCKFRHEMPLDRATQHAMGLFHGLPTWWKKHQAELQRQRSAPASPGGSTMSSGGSGGPGPATAAQVPALGRSQGANGAAGADQKGFPPAPVSLWGPIGTPPGQERGLAAGQRPGLARSRHNQG